MNRIAVPPLLPSLAVLEFTCMSNHACRYSTCPWESGENFPGPHFSPAP